MQTQTNLQNKTETKTNAHTFAQKQMQQNLTMQKITKRKNEKRKTKFNNAEKITKKEKRIHTKTKNEKNTNQKV